MGSTKQVLADMYFQIWESGEVTDKERSILHTLLTTSEGLDEFDRALLDRLLHAIHRGWINFASPINIG